MLLVMNGLWPLIASVRNTGNPGTSSLEQAPSFGRERAVMRDGGTRTSNSRHPSAATLPLAPSWW
jgi:hypothetical protein